jgi:hypothetical protein
MPQPVNAWDIIGKRKQNTNQPPSAVSFHGVNHKECQPRKSIAVPKLSGTKRRKFRRLVV